MCFIFHLRLKYCKNQSRLFDKKCNTYRNIFVQAINFLLALGKLLEKFLFTFLHLTLGENIQVITKSLKGRNFQVKYSQYVTELHLVGLGEPQDRIEKQL